MWEGTFIAECGSNHEGDLGRAKELIRIAVQAGCDVVKFQLWTDPEITARGNIPLSFDMFKELYEYHQEINLGSSILTASVFDWSSLEFLLQFKPKYIKFAYSKRHWKQGIQAAYENGAIPIVSTNILEVHKLPSHVIPLFCIPEYPVLYKIDFQALSNTPAWSLFQGFSDHTPGFLQTTVAAAYPNMKFIEKHIRLDEGSAPDHWFSIDKWELDILLRSIGRDHVGITHSSLTV